jgi:predicted nuclease of predicted toxin-antitoxin system
MRLLFDEHLSGRLPALLADLYPESLQVNGLALDGAPDEAIWRAAAERDCLLVTKDEDFHRLSVLRGAPPKVVWLRLGNCTTDDVARLLRDQVDAIRRFALHEEATYLELGAPQQR